MTIDTQLKQGCHVLFTVCPGYNQQTGAAFLEAVKAMLADSRIAKITLLLADSLQKYVIAAKQNIPLSEAASKAANLFTEWEADNTPALNMLKMSGKLEAVLNWEHCLNCNNFPKADSFINSIYSNSSSEDGGKLKGLTRGLKNAFAKQLQETCIRENFTLLTPEEKIKKQYEDYNLEQNKVFYMLAHDDAAGYHHEFTFCERNTAMRHIHLRYCSDERMRHFCLSGQKRRNDDNLNLLYDTPNLLANNAEHRSDEERRLALALESLAKGLATSGRDSAWVAQTFAVFCEGFGIFPSRQRQTSEPIPITSPAIVDASCNQDHVSDGDSPQSSEPLLVQATPLALSLPKGLSSQDFFHFCSDIQPDPSLCPTKNLPHPQATPFLGI